MGSSNDEIGADQGEVTVTISDVRRLIELLTSCRTCETMSAIAEPVTTILRHS